MEDTVKLARDLARIARENDLAEIEYRSRGQRIRLLREEPAPSLAPPAGYYPPPPPASAVPATPPAPAAAASPGATLNAPLAGVFYRAPRPGAPDFVEVGQQVSAGQTLCILEAMKTMNEIPAESGCRILKVLVENAQVVVTGQALFEIEPLA